MPQWPEDDSPLHTQQLQYEKWREKGAKTFKEWAKEWGMEYKSASNRLQRLAYCGEAKIVFSYYPTSAKVRVALWTITGRRIPSRIQPSNTWTRLQYADARQVGVAVASLRIKQMTSSGLRHKGLLQGPKCPSRYYDIQDIEKFERVLGIRQRITFWTGFEFTAGGFHLLLGYNCKEAIHYWIAKKRVEKVGLTPDRNGSKQSNSFVLYRLTPIGKKYLKTKQEKKS